MDQLEALMEARRRAGSQQALAKVCIRKGKPVSQPAVWRWLNKTKRLPADFVLPVERAFGVSRHDLRPDIYPRELARVNA